MRERLVMDRWEGWIVLRESETPVSEHVQTAGKPGLAVAQSCLLRVVKALMKPKRVSAPE